MGKPGIPGVNGLDVSIFSCHRICLLLANLFNTNAPISVSLLCNLFEKRFRLLSAIPGKIDQKVMLP